MVNLSKRKRNRVVIFLILFIALIFLIMITGVVVNVRNEENAKRAAISAKKARLTSDPITVDGIYTAINKQRAKAGAPALSSLENLTIAAKKNCSDMVKYKYFDYKNPKNGKDSNVYITDEMRDLYYKKSVTSIFSANKNEQTASDAAKIAIANKATNLNDPEYNSVGWATCSSPDNTMEVYIVGMLANKQDKPVTNNAVNPTYQNNRTTCHTTYNDYNGYFSPTATTNCY